MLSTRSRLLAITGAGSGAGGGAGCRCRRRCDSLDSGGAGGGGAAVRAGGVAGAQAQFPRQVAAWRKPASFWHVATCCVTQAAARGQYAAFCAGGRRSVAEVVEPVLLVVCRVLLVVEPVLLLVVEPLLLVVEPVLLVVVMLLVVEPVLLVVEPVLPVVEPVLLVRGGDSVAPIGDVVGGGVAVGAARADEGLPVAGAIAAARLAAGGAKLVGAVAAGCGRGAALAAAGGRARRWSCPPRSLRSSFPSSLRSSLRSSSPSSRFAPVFAPVFAPGIAPMSGPWSTYPAARLPLAPRQDLGIRLAAVGARVAVEALCRPPGTGTPSATSCWCKTRKVPFPDGQARSADHCTDS